MLKLEKEEQDPSAPEVASNATDYMLIILMYLSISSGFHLQRLANCFSVVVDQQRM